MAIVVFTGFATLDAWLLVRSDEFGTSLPATASRTLVVAFYVLLVIAYLRRKPSEATDRHPIAWAAAFAGTTAPFFIPVLGGDRLTDGLRASASTTVLLIGSAFMVWALTSLGSSISLVPQARRVVTTGPYRWVRHPLYAAEIFNTTGVCLAFHGAWPWVVLACMVGIQYFRARREETLLAATLSGYASYQARTPMLVPRPPVRV